LTRLFAGCALGLRGSSQLRLQNLGVTREKYCVDFSEDKGAASEEPVNGRAQPFLTTGGEAMRKENLAKKENKKLPVCYTDFRDKKSESRGQ